MLLDCVGLCCRVVQLRQHILNSIEEVQATIEHGNNVDAAVAAFAEKVDLIDREIKGKIAR